MYDELFLHARVRAYCGAFVRRCTSMTDASHSLVFFVRSVLYTRFFVCFLCLHENSCESCSPSVSRSGCSTPAICATTAVAADAAVAAAATVADGVVARRRTYLLVLGVPRKAGALAEILMLRVMRLLAIPRAVGNLMTSRCSGTFKLNLKANFETIFSLHRLKG
jgi:hypothetical protein